MTDWELIIVNDGSSDRTEDIVKFYVGSGLNIKYHRQENKGFGAARNKCLELAGSDYIAIIDHDDICLPNRLEAQIKTAREQPQAALLFSDSEHFLDNGTVLRRQFDSFDTDPSAMNLSAGSAAENLLYHGCFVDSETVLFRKDAAVKIGGFNALYKYIVDYDFFLRIGERYVMVCDSRVLARWRVHPRQASRIMRETIYLETMDLLNKWESKPTISTEIQTAVRLHLWLCRVRYSLFLCSLGRFKESGKPISNLFNKNIALGNLLKFLFKKTQRRLYRK